MKRIIIFLIILLIVFGFNKKEETIPVINTLDIVKDESQIIYLTVPNLTSKNISNYFDDTSSIIGIYPYVNPLYQKKIGDMFYQFNSASLDSNIKNFIKIYKQKLSNNNFNNDLTLIDYNGIKIETVKMYMSKRELKDFLLMCKKCNYSFTIR